MATTKLKLEIQPIPISSWGISLATKLDKDKWDEIRHEVYRRADYACQICRSTDRELHCHEVWGFDDKKKIQRLVRLECCCKLCHDVHHFGRSKEVYGKAYIEKLIKHWCEVNKKTQEDFQRYGIEIFRLSKKRADVMYTIKVGRRILV